MNPFSWAQTNLGPTPTKIGRARSGPFYYGPLDVLTFRHLVGGFNSFEKHESVGSIIPSQV